MDKKAEYQAYCDWAFKKEGEAIGRMDGNDAGWAGWEARALLSASIADTAGASDLALSELFTRAAEETNDWCDRQENEPTKMQSDAVFVRTIVKMACADTAGAKCGTCGAVGTVTSTKARCTLCGMFADTAGAKPVTGPWPTDAMNAAGMRELAAFHKSRGDTVDAIYLAMSAAAPPASSVADATVLRCGDCGSYHIERLEAYSSPVVAEDAPSEADAAGASEDARDASRWRHLRNCGVIVDFTRAGPWKFTDDVDAAVDKLMSRSAAINAASASKTTERKKLCKGSHFMCEGREYCLGHPSCSDLEKESGND